MLSSIWVWFRSVPCGCCSQEKHHAEMGATEVRLKIWHALKLRWHLRGASVLKWQFCSELLSAHKQYQEGVSEMHQGCEPQYFNHPSSDESKRTAVADVKTAFGAFRWRMFSNAIYIIIYLSHLTRPEIIYSDRIGSIIFTCPTRTDISNQFC